MEAVLRRVLKRITPTPEEEREIASAIELVREAVERAIGRLQYTFAGSFTRNTWMRDKKEFDVFILFPEQTGRAALEKRGLELGKKIVSSLKGSWSIAYAEHPYTRAVVRGFAVDIVPCYKIRDPSAIKSAVDRTPFHNRYLAKHFHPELAQEVRLLKQFLKAGRLYGSDARTQGFSGYLCELLILHYRSFRSLVEAASSWEAGQFIDLEGHHTKPDGGKAPADLIRARPSFPGQPLIAIDPVDPKRNVAAVLSPLNFARFTSLCRAFLKRPGEGYFFPQRKRAEAKKLKGMMKRRGTAFLGVEFRRPGVIEDILYPQLRRTSDRVASLLKGREFLVLGSEAFAGETACILLFELEVWKLPLVRKVVGPPLSVKKHAEEFLQKYRKGRLWVEDGKWVAEVGREFPLAEEFLSSVLRKPAKRLQEMGVASHIAGSLSKGFRVLEGKDLLKKARSPDFAAFLLDYLERRVEA